MIWSSSKMFVHLPEVLLRGNLVLSPISFDVGFTDHIPLGASDCCEAAVHW